jgi:outer membrane protein OmpA-like peptidoglycan-associated protein
MGLMERLYIFASNRESGYGGFDIYRSERRADGSWSKAINLGPAVNTKNDEKSPYLLNNGKVLTFSSQGHLNMGGYDLFYIDYPLDSDSKARNMGYPINTVNDELSFCPLELNTGYTSRYDEKGLGITDILKAQYSGFPNLFEVPVKATVKVTGIPDNEAVSFYIIDQVINDTIEFSRASADENTHDYILYPGNFQLLAKSTALESEKAAFEVPSTIKGGLYQFPITVVFNNPSTEKPTLNQLVTDTIDLQNIAFDFNSSELNSNSVPLLNKIASFLGTHPGVSISITGYTDVIGNNAYNKILSVKRADKVKLYLQNKGIETSRMKITVQAVLNLLPLTPIPMALTTRKAANTTAGWNLCLKIYLPELL